MKPCPFCGNKKPRLFKVLSSNRKIIVGWRVLCEPDKKPCGAEGPIMGKKPAALRAWEKRS